MTVYTVLYYRPPGPAGPAGDGTHVMRFRSRKLAEEFARGRTCYGSPCVVDRRDDVPRRIMRRWGLA